MYVLFTHLLQDNIKTVESIVSLLMT